MLANLFIGVAERIMSRKLIALEPIDVSKTGLMMINNACGMLLLVPLQVAFGEAARLPEVVAFSARQWTLLALSCVVAVGISYAGINLQKHVTASTFMVLQNANKFVVVAFGIVVLQEVRLALRRAGEVG